MDWSIQQIAKIAGTTSRTLRHYDDIGLMHPSRVARNGYRHYDQAALIRLQRILLLRQLGLGLPQIADVLSHEIPPLVALTAHLGWLEQEQQRLARQIMAVRSTIEAWEGGEQLMAQNMFDGFDHTQYQEEVTRRWGTDAYSGADAWWRGKTAAGRAEWQERLTELNQNWVAAAESGMAPDAADAQALAARHVEWLRSVPGTPAGRSETRAYIEGLGEMYVADPRFGANYATAEGGAAGAEFVRDALRIYVGAHL